ncbi:hypothetical protein A8C34_05525 [Ligilactobacillus salivarius]|nr:hypothetical protein A8C34_05525 [Ligilactobacillus salivarius]
MLLRQDKTRQDKTRQDKTRQDKTRQDKLIIYSQCVFVKHFLRSSLFFLSSGLFFVPRKVVA